MMLVIKMLLINAFISIFIKENIRIVSPGICRSLLLLVCCCKMKTVDRNRNLDSPVDFLFRSVFSFVRFRDLLLSTSFEEEYFLSANKLKNKD